MKTMATLTALVVAVFGGALRPVRAALPSTTLHPAADEWNPLVNGDFENGATGWTKTKGYFAVTEYPDPSNHVGVLRGASGYTSEITQTMSNLTPGKYAIFVSTQGHSSCSTTVTVESGGQAPFTTTENSNFGLMNLDFCVPAGASSATVKISVTGTGLGRYIQIDGGFVIFMGICG